MIEKTISNKVLFLGPPYKNPKGGIAIVINAYSKLCESFNFIATTNLGGFMSNFFYFIKALIIYHYYLIFRNIHIVHIQGSSFMSFWRAAVFICIAKLFKKKIIYHIHGGCFKDFSSQHKKSVQSIFSKCDVIGVLSTKWKVFFEQEFQCKDVRIIPNIIEYPREDHSNRENYPIQFLFLGKISERKGIFDLVNIIDENKNTFEGKMKLIIGGNGETDRLEITIKEKKLDEIIQFAGWVSGEKKTSLLNNSHVFILPSYIEAYPISILEAMSYHLPVIATNVGDIPEIIHDGKEGYLVEPGNKTQILNAIMNAFNSPTSLMEMGNKGFERCKVHLSNNVEKELTQLYNSLL